MRRMLRGGRIIILVATLMMLSTPVTAQWLDAGQRIRVTAPQLSLQRQPGQLLWLDQDSLVLVADLQRWVVPREMLTQLDSSRGYRSHLFAGLAVGAAVGFGVGAILFPPNSTGCTGSGDYAENCHLYRAGIAVGGVSLGALAGALISTERWKPLPLESVQFRPTPRNSPP